MTAVWPPRDLGVWLLAALGGAVLAPVIAINRLSALVYSVPLAAGAIAALVAGWSTDPNRQPAASPEDYA
jgi:hypothetical protein